MSCTVWLVSPMPDVVHIRLIIIIIIGRLLSHHVHTYRNKVRKPLVRCWCFLSDDAATVCVPPAALTATRYTAPPACPRTRRVGLSRRQKTRPLHAVYKRPEAWCTACDVRQRHDRAMLEVFAWQVHSTTATVLVQRPQDRIFIVTHIAHIWLLFADSAQVPLLCCPATNMIQQKPAHV